MAMSMNIHSCTAIKTASHYPENSNCISILVETAETRIEISMFGLPKEVTDKLLSLFPTEVTHTDTDAVLTHDGWTTQR